MPINGPFEELVGISSGKINSMSNVAYTGAEIAALSATAIDGQVVYCYLTGSGFTRGTWWGWDDDKNEWQQLNGLPEYIEFFDIHRANVAIDRRSFTKEMWVCSNSGTSSAVNFTNDGTQQYLELVTGTSSTGWAEARVGGLKIDFAEPAFLIVAFRTPSTTTGQVVKLGVNIDRAGTGPSTQRNFGAEYCDGDIDWMMHSGDGTDQSNEDTDLDIVASQDNFWYIFFNPGESVDYNFSDLSQYQKLNDIPFNGADGGDAAIRLSIANNAGSSTSKTLRIYAAYLAYNKSGNWPN